MTKRAILLASALALIGLDAQADGVTFVQGIDSGTGKQCLVGTSATCQLPSNASVSASITPFAPSSATSSVALAPNAGSVSAALPTGSVAYALNDGSAEAFIALGGNAVTANTSGMALPAGSCQAVTVGSNTYIAAYSAGSTTVRVTGGSGLSGSCGGGGGSSFSGTPFGATNATSGLALGYYTGSAFNQVTSAQPLPTNCVSGCAGGTSSNGSDAVATGSSNGQQLGFNYGFNGTTWDRLRSDANKYLYVSLGASALSDGWNPTEGATTGGICASAASACTDNQREAHFEALLGGVGTVKQQDSGGGDATDTTNHSVKVTVQANGTAAGLQVSWAPTAASRARGSASATGTSAVTVIPAPGAGNYLHIKSCQIGRSDTGSAAITVTLNDSASTPIVVPGGSGGNGNNPVYDVPLVLAANTALTFTPSAATTTVYASCQGWYDNQSN